MVSELHGELCQCRLLPREMASELHAWRQRRTVKINSEGRLSRPGVASLLRSRPAARQPEHLETPEIAARLAGTAEPKGSGWLPETGKGRGRPFVWR